MINSKTQVTYWVTCDRCGKQMFVESERLPRKWRNVTVIEADRKRNQDLCPDCMTKLKERDLWEGSDKISFEIGGIRYGKR